MDLITFEVMRNAFVAACYEASTTIERVAYHPVVGMVGGLMILRSTYFEPLQAFSPTTSFTIVTIAILGGSDEVSGPLLGAILLVLMSELLWARAPEIYMIPSSHRAEGSDATEEAAGGK